jgi:hypothetical protein
VANLLLESGSSMMLERESSPPSAPGASFRPSIATLRRRRAGAAPPTSGPEPNPAETVFTLGPGGAVWSGSVASGFALSLATTLLNGGVVLSYPDSAALDASVWRGGGEASLFSPAVAWSLPAAGAFTLAISAGQTTNLEAGSYRLQVGVTVGGVRSLAFDGPIEVTDTVGTVAPAMTWCAADDMLLYSDQIRSLQSSRGADVTGFLAQRGQATSKRSRAMVNRYRPRNGFVRVRQNQMDPILDTMDVPNPTAVPPSKADLTTALATLGGIVLEEKIVEIVARDAIALVLRRQATSANARAYLEEAEAQVAMADDLFRCYQAQVITATPIGVGVVVTIEGTPTSAGFSNFLIDHDCVILPEGTAP